MNKKGQWTHAAARERRSQERKLRKIYARALTNLGFKLNEIVDFLNVSTNTVKTYLKETEGEGYSDLFDFALKEDIIDLFTKSEQEFLNSIKESMDLSQKLSKESKKISNIIQGVGISGFFQKFFSDIEDLKKKQKEVNKQILNLAKKMKKTASEIKNQKKYPHLSKSNLKLEVEVRQQWSCEYCLKPFDTKEEAEKHEKDCKKKVQK